MATQRGIVIAGGAFAGLALALALRQGLGADIPIVVADPALALKPSRDPRASAIVAACRRLFGAIGVWDDVAASAQPILDMVVTDSALEDATRPVFLTFAGEVEPGEPFAHMVENRLLIDALVRRAEAGDITLRAGAVTGFAARPEAVTVTFDDGAEIEAALLVAADGARSRLRERAGIATHGWDYDQSGIVVTVGHERDHEGRAEEHFLPVGAVRDPAADGTALVAGVDRAPRRGRAAGGAPRRRIPSRAGGALRPQARRSRACSTSRGRFRSAISWRARSSPSGWR